MMVGLGWDVNQFDTGADFDLDTAAFLLADSGKVTKTEDFVFLWQSETSFRLCGAYGR